MATPTDTYGFIMGPPKLPSMMMVTILVNPFIHVVPVLELCIQFHRMQAAYSLIYGKVAVLPFQNAVGNTS